MTNTAAPRTENTTVSELAVGDVITRLGNVTFPFPFTLSSVTKVGNYGTVMRAEHGWFNPRPLPGTEKVTRVIA